MALPLHATDSHRSAGVERDRPIVLVVGMHRSGTSLLSHILHGLGVGMADNTNHASRSNPDGFWERPAIVALQDDVLKAIGRPLDSPLHSLPFQRGWWLHEDVQPIRRRLRELVSEQLSEYPGLWGFKDPRTCRLLPLWWEIFEELGLKAHYAWAVRTPGEVSASMAAKLPSLRPMTPAQAEVTWLAYNYDVLRYTTEANRVVVDYSAWFMDPIATACRIRDKLALPGLTSEQERLESLSHLVKERYRHQREGAGNASIKMALAESFYRDIAASARDESTHLLDRYGPTLDLVFGALGPFVELLAEMPKIRAKLREAMKSLARMADQQTADLDRYVERIKELESALDAVKRQSRK